MSKIVKIVKIVDTDRTNNSSFGDLSVSSSDPGDGLSSLRWEISRLQTLEQGLVKFSRSFTLESDVEAMQGRRDNRIRKSLAIVAGLALLTAVAMAIFTVAKVMKDENVRFVAESGGNSPVTFQELQMHNTEQDCWVLLHDDVYDLTSYAKDHHGGSFLVTDLAGNDGTGSFDAFHPVQLLKTVQRYRIGPLVEEVSVQDQESEGVSLDDDESSDSEAQDTPPAENENAAPPAEDDSPQVVVVASISWEELALHNTPADCWLALHGDVYDLTAYAPSHPGGDGMITLLAGTDGADMYDIFHEPILLETVQQFKVGPLAAPLARN